MINNFVFQTNVPFRRINEEHVDVDPRLQDNSFDAKVSFTSAVSIVAPQVHPGRSDPAGPAPFREEPTGTGARKPMTSSSSPRANHSDTKRQKRRGGATAEEPSPPQSTPSGSTVTEDRLNQS